MRYARRGRRHVRFLVFFELEEVEIVAAIFLLPGARESFFRNGEERKAGWKSERLLAAGQKHVDPEIVHWSWDGGEGRDRVYDQNDFRILADDGADFFERIHDASRGFA